MPANPTTRRIAEMCQNYNDLPQLAPFMVVRHAKPSHPENGARREHARVPMLSPVAIVLAIKPTSSGPGRMASEGVVFPATKYSERALGRNTIVEKSIVITHTEIQNHLVEVFCGEPSIYGWVFSQSGQKPVVTWLSPAQVLAHTVCHLGANIEYKFDALEPDNEAAHQAMMERIKCLADLVMIKPRSDKVIDAAREIVAQLQLVGLEEGFIYGGLEVALRKIIREFATTLLSGQQR
jgi:hypothetical protein